MIVINFASDLLNQKGKVLHGDTVFVRSEAAWSCFTVIRHRRAVSRPAFLEENLSQKIKAFECPAKPVSLERTEEQHIVGADLNIHLSPAFSSFARLVQNVYRPVEQSHRSFLRCSRQVSAAEWKSVPHQCRICNSVSCATEAEDCKAR